MVSRLLSLSSFHPQKPSNGCLHSSNDEELTLFETILLEKNVRRQLRGAKSQECVIIDLGSNPQSLTIHKMRDQFPHLQNKVDVKLECACDDSTWHLGGILQTIETLDPAVTIQFTACTAVEVPKCKLGE